MEDYLSMISVLGFIFSLVSIIIALFPIVSNKISNYNMQRKRRLFDYTKNEDVYRWLIQYYQRQKDVDLYECKFNSVFKVPFIVCKKWIVFQDVNQISSPLLSKMQNHPSPVSQTHLELIEERKRLYNQRIFNGNTLCLKRANNDDTTSQCTGYTEAKYYNLAGCAFELENETYRAVRSKKKGTPLRDKFLSTPTAILNSTDNRFVSIGGAVVTCIKRDGKWGLLLHRRSNKVVTAQGLKSVIPQFGFEEIMRKEERTFSDQAFGNQGLVIYNIIKEFAEELFGYEELISNINSQKNLWNLSDIPEIKEFLDLYKNKKIRIIYLGQGFEALIGTKMLSFLTLIEDEKFSKRIIDYHQLNWESDVIFEQNDMEFIELSETGIRLLEEYQAQNLLTSVSSFAISRAIQWLQKSTKIKQS